MFEGDPEMVCNALKAADGVQRISFTGDGASDTGLGAKAGARLRDITGPRAGAGDGDFPNNSFGRRTLLTVKMVKPFAAID